MADIEVKPDLLRWAIQRSRRDELELVKRFPKIWKWVDGSEKPTFKQLEKFAKFTYTPFGYFFLLTPPPDSLPIPLYRTIDSAHSLEDVSANLLDTINLMQFRQSWMREYLREQGEEPLSFINSATINETAQVISQRIRTVLNLENNWASRYRTWTDALGGFCEKIEDAGILVVVNGLVGNNTHRKLNVEEFRGFVLVDEYAPLLFVNGSDGKAAQMFTFAHELAHVFLGQSAVFDLRGCLPSKNRIEQKCDQVAAEILVPRTEFRAAWKRVLRAENRFQRLAEEFKVSEIVIARRALDLHFINKQDFLSFYDRYQTEEHALKAAKAGGGDFYRNQKNRIGKRFGETVVIAAKEGSLLYSEAYRLTGLYGKTFDGYSHSLGYEV